MAETRVAGLVYATASLSIRSLIRTLPGEPPEVLDGWRLMDGEAMVIFQAPVAADVSFFTPEYLSDRLAEALGLDAQLVHRNTRHAVIDNQSREVVRVEEVAPEFVAPPKGHQVKATQVGELGWKYTTKGEWLARMVAGSKDGVVEAIEWIAPDLQDEKRVAYEKDGRRFVIHPDAQPGDEVAHLKTTEMETSGVKEF